MANKTPSQVTHINGTYRTACGRGRATYSQNRAGALAPWAVVMDGTVLCYRNTLGGAAEKLKEKGCAL